MAWVLHCFNVHIMRPFNIRHSLSIMDLDYWNIDNIRPLLMMTHLDPKGMLGFLEPLQKHMGGRLNSIALRRKKDKGYRFWDWVSLPRELGDIAFGIRYRFLSSLH